jgi:acyl carrier protein
MRERILEIIRAAIDLENKLRDTPIDISAGENTQLYGLNAQVDSMGLVSLVVEVEGEIERQLNVRVTLAHPDGLGRTFLSARAHAELTSSLSR